MWQIHGFKMQMIIWGQTSIPEDHDTPPIQSKSLPVSNNNDLRSMPKALQKKIYELTNTENIYTDCLRYRSRTAIGDGDPLDNVGAPANEVENDAIRARGDAGIGDEEKQATVQANSRCK
jgi:hypothetical protein